MKAIFPCLGSLIMTKTDIETLTEFYNSRQIQNNGDNIIVHNSFFNYFNDNSEIVLDNVTPLTISKLKKVLGISSPTKEPEQENVNITEEYEVEEDDEEPISDESIFSNPFFATLKPVDEGE